MNYRFCLVRWGGWVGSFGFDVFLRVDKDGLEGIVCGFILYILLFLGFIFEWLEW